MAEVTLRFRHNPATGKRELVISYESDDDALAHEHERDHRALVEKLIGQPIGADTEIVVERSTKDGVPESPNGETGRAPEHKNRGH
ncbi:MAG: hypothetical protein U0165_18630 [Polyangiaceae bacterium]